MRNKTLSAIIALSGLAAVAMPADARVKRTQHHCIRTLPLPSRKGSMIFFPV